MHSLLKAGLFSIISLFGGLCFAAAPIASVNLGSASVAPSQPVTSQNTNDSSAPNTNNSIAASQSLTPVVNSAALLASLTPEQRISRLENQVQYLSNANSQLQSVSSEVDILRGQMENLTYQVQQLKKQINSLNTAVQNLNSPPTPAAATSTTVTTNAQNPANNTTATNTPANAAATTKSATPTSAAPTPAATAPAPAAAKPSAKEQADFTQAYNLLLKQQYTAATTGFTNFLSNYPNSTLVPDAHYWLGDLYLAQGQPDNASQQYRAVVNTQNATKRPDAMVKLGTILLAYGDSAHAKQLFQQVLQQYPNTAAATQAQARLKSM